MNNFLKMAVVAMALAVPSVSHAVVVPTVTIDGITIGIGPFSFVSADVMGNLTGDTLSGRGQVLSIKSGTSTVWTNGTNGRELTFMFDNYINTYGTASILEYTGGTVKFYSSSSSVNAADFSTGSGFTDGNLWMDLVGTAFTSNVTGDEITLSSSGTLLGSDISGNNTGLLSVTGLGLADAYFDTDTKLALGTGNLADWVFTSSFATNLSFADGVAGTTNLNGTSQAVPEPAPLALMGIGLLGLGMTTRRRQTANLQ